MKDFRNPFHKLEILLLGVVIEKDQPELNNKKGVTGHKRKEYTTEDQ